MPGESRDNRDQSFKQEYLKKLLIMIIDKHQSIQVLKKKLEDLDKSFVGTIPVNKFKECIMELEIGVRMSDLNKLTRTLAKLNGKVKYYTFLNELQRYNIAQDGPKFSHNRINEVFGEIKEFAKALERVIQSKQLTLGEFLQEIGNRYNEIDEDD